MKIIIKIATLLLAIGCTYIAKSQACTGSGNIISSQTTSSALGSNNTVSVNNSTAIGKNNTISYTTSTNPSYTIGNNNNMTKPYSIALGLISMLMLHRQSQSDICLKTLLIMV